MKVPWKEAKDLPRGQSQSDRLCIWDICIRGVPESRCVGEGKFPQFLLSSSGWPNNQIDMKQANRRR